MSSYTRNLCKSSDIQEHLGLLHGLALKCDQVVEFGFRTGVSASAFLAAGCKVRSYDIDSKCRPHVQRLAKEYPKTFVFKSGDSREVIIPKCDLLFLDTDHTFETTWTELYEHAGRVKKWIILHDTKTFGRKDRPPGKGPGIMTAVDRFLEMNKFWHVLLHLRNCNGLTILERLS